MKRRLKNSVPLHFFIFSFLRQFRHFLLRKPSDSQNLSASWSSSALDTLQCSSPLSIYFKEFLYFLSKHIFWASIHPRLTRRILTTTEPASVILLLHSFPSKKTHVKYRDREHIQPSWRFAYVTRTWPLWYHLKSSPSVCSCLWTPSGRLATSLNQLFTSNILDNLVSSNTSDEDWTGGGGSWSRRMLFSLNWLWQSTIILHLQGGRNKSE